MAIALLSLGSNVEPETHLRAAIAALRARFEDVVVSGVYRFPAVGYTGPDFLNAAVTLRTDLAPAALNDWLHALEDAHGRDRSGPRYSDRTLDIDIVLFDDAVLDGAGNLRIPRDELRHAFVLKPAAEIAPDWRHPLDGTPLAQRWATHPDRDTVFERVGGFDPAPGV
ncbi:2-amino-4-hydroxy-6-hydroxymethyldihydropteridine diphosphokinase [Lysobacteraceae bacterium NML93-0792]|nr:2-amino-4-hydroxy-6-hydroxymethyldihydropteridine diphosphokinase [Xanthomonadaceae bacterium NML93-0792]PBS17329.1 2-amino-4-hydroxy-6-hydroxymethyldihydropteridine diphosphokinase [Xanthomonadaceae bacterium NML93-0793]PBS20529.1 2-amino-4-hydroxy-6-hydroxymethyldihydropteridine diphosphokinase [Xanthomonadaceae bacterium NML93-0831]